MKYKEIDVLIGSKLKALREKKGYSIRYVGQRIGKTHATVSYYEQGRNGADLSTLKKLCNLYGVDMLQFLSDIYEEI